MVSANTSHLSSEAEGARLAEGLINTRQHQEDGRCSPHKPLLILLALAKLAQTGSSSLEWEEIDAHLSSLLAEFGPSRKSGPKPEYPFTRLRSDKVWELSREVPMDRIAPLREGSITGKFVDVLEDYLKKNPTKILETARLVVEQQFPRTIAGDVLDSVGFDSELVLTEGTTRAFKVQARTRSSAWRQDVLQAWDRACALCGFDGQAGAGPVGIEAAHIRWFNFGGPDTLDSGMALCSLHHKLLDPGVLGFFDSRTVVVSKNFSARSAEGKRVYDLHMTEIAPRPGVSLPAREHITWHTNEVFQGEPLE